MKTNFLQAKGDKCEPAKTTTNAKKLHWLKNDWKKDKWSEDFDIECSIIGIQLKDRKRLIIFISALLKKKEEEIAEMLEEARSNRADEIADDLKRERDLIVKNNPDAGHRFLEVSDEFIKKIRTYRYKNL